MQEFYEGLAEILEVPPAEINSSFDLTTHAWDSLAVVSTIALCDDCFNIMLSGQDLGKCQTVAEIEALIAAKRPA
ncbi:MAG: acyl carrier protein [Rubrivivax sp.]|nr:MAG: acyl carrier protein [Rubrivivax sp.]